MQIFKEIKKKLLDSEYTVKRTFGSANYIAEKKGKKIFIEVKNYGVNAISFEKDRAIIIISLEGKDYSILREYKAINEEKFSALKCPKCSHELTSDKGNDIEDSGELAKLSSDKELIIYKDSIRKKDIWFCENCENYYYTDAKKEKYGDAEKCKFCKTKNAYKYRFGWKVAEIIEEIIVFKCEKCNKHYFEDESFDFLLEK